MLRIFKIAANINIYPIIGQILHRKTGVVLFETESLTNADLSDANLTLANLIGTKLLRFLYTLNYRT